MVNQRSRDQWAESVLQSLPPIPRLMDGPSRPTMRRAAPVVVRAMPPTHIQRSARFNRTQNDRVNVWNSGDVSRIYFQGTREIGTREIGTHEIGTREIGTREIGTREIGTHEIGTREIGTREIGTREIGTHEIGTREIGTREIGTREIGTREIGTREIGTHEIGTREIGTLFHRCLDGKTELKRIWLASHLVRQIARVLH